MQIPNMLAQAERAPGPALLDGAAQQRVVALGNLGLARRMVQVDRQRLKLQIAPADARVVETRGNLVVLAPPADEGFVEAVHSEQVALPVGLVAATDGSLAGTFVEHEPAEQKVADGVAAAADVWGEES
jgi:hypothetical protein